MLPNTGRCHWSINELIGLYWDIGRAIEERQDREGWGESVVERLSADLQSEFGAKNGFSTQNLWYMRNFYREYSALPNLQPLVGEVSWSKHLIILARCKMPLSARANSLHTAERIDVVTPQPVTNHAA